MWDLYLFLHKTTVCVSGFSNEKNNNSQQIIVCVIVNC